MGEFLMLIKAVKKDKENFCLIMEKMEPLINKYTRLLYKDESEDTKAELYEALWVAVCKISYCDKEGQVVTYLCTALKNRYLELYRKSKKLHDNTICIEGESDDLKNMFYHEEGYEDIIVSIDQQKFLDSFSETRKEIVILMIVDELSDREISERLSLSRQYVNRVRRMVKRRLGSIGYFDGLQK